VSRAKRRKQQRTETIKEPYSTIIDVVSERDREAMSDRPDGAQAARRYIPGEFYGSKPALPEVPIAVVITKIADGLRMRQPIFEWTLHGQPLSAETVAIMEAEVWSDSPYWFNTFSGTGMDALKGDLKDAVVTIFQH
jgi:hypothetical protein